MAARGIATCCTRLRSATSPRYYPDYPKRLVLAIGPGSPRRSAALRPRSTVRPNARLSNHSRGRALNSSQLSARPRRHNFAMRQTAARLVPALVALAPRLHSLFLHRSSRRASGRAAAPAVARRAAHSGRVAAAAGRVAAAAVGSCRRATRPAATVPATRPRAPRSSADASSPPTAARPCAARRCEPSRASCAPIASSAPMRKGVSSSRIFLRDAGT